MSTIRVLGAGVAGLCVATELVARGVEVELVDPAGNPGPEACSWWAGGMLAPFCEYESAEDTVLRLGQQAKHWWSRYTRVTEAGTLVVAHRRDHADLRRFASRTERFHKVDAAGMRKLEPDLYGFEHGLFFESEAHLDPRKALADLSRHLAGNGVGICREPSATTADQTIDCRGFSARDALADLRGVKGEMLVLRAPDVSLTRPIRLLHPRIPLYVVPRGQGVYMLGATMIESADRKRITARSMLELLSAAYALNPAFGEAEVLEIGVDVRPAFPDNLPRVRRVGSTIHANGLYRHGFLLAPALASAVAELAINHIQTEFADDCLAER
ncbi:MAG: FAD-dependent oxidoreductase [Silicimonas sp.]|jgi:glycine oxidase|nr:FAD-dependent oxidoreductase [Silicimonas sp.]